MSINYTLLSALSQCWDIEDWEGMKMPRRNAFILRVPPTLYEEFDGEYTKTQIRDLAKRHAAAGVYPLVHFTSITPIITTISEALEEITISWDHHEPGTTYSIYLATGTPPSTWKLATLAAGGHATGIAENPIANTATVEARHPGTTNHIYVSATHASSPTMPPKLDVVKYASIQVTAIP